MDYLGHYLNRTFVPSQLLSQYADRSTKATETLPEQALRKRPPAKHRHLTQSEVADLVSRYASGQTLKVIANEFGVNPKTVSIILKREGVPSRHRKLNEDSIEQATKLYNQGLSLEAVATQLGVTTGTTHYAFKQRGIPCRPVGTNQWR